MKTINNYELRVKPVTIADAGEPYHAALHDPDDAARVAQAIVGDLAQEVFIVLHLDVKSRVLGYSETARGGVATCPVDITTVFRTAIALGASGILVAHNHPSGDLQPSAEDLKLTERLTQAAEILGITLLDHVIVTYAGYASLRALDLI